MEQCQGRSRQTGGKYIYTDIALMSLQHGDFRLNLKKQNPSNIPFNSKGDCYYLLYKQNVILKAQLPAA